MPSIKKGVDLFEKKFKLDVNDAKKKLAKAMFTRLIRGTPVLTGHLKYNWQVSLRGFGSERPGVDPTGSKALSEGLATIRSVQTGQHIYIYNATSYGKYVVSQHENYRTALTLASRQLRAGLELKF